MELNLLGSKYFLKKFTKRSGEGAVLIRKGGSNKIIEN